jgi:hypothetical protein
MAQHALIEIELPIAVEQFKLPEGVHVRLQSLLDQQDRGEPLSDSERKEAEGLVDLVERLSLVRLRAQRV